MLLIFDLLSFYKWQPWCLYSRCFFRSSVCRGRSFAEATYMHSWGKKIRTISNEAEDRDLSVEKRAPWHPPRIRPTRSIKATIFVLNTRMYVHTVRVERCRTVWNDFKIGRTSFIRTGREWKHRWNSRVILIIIEQCWIKQLLPLIFEQRVTSIS